MIEERYAEVLETQRDALPHGGSLLWTTGVWPIYLDGDTWELEERS